MNVEARLAELIGEAAGRLHTARSRNDQVATDFRLFVRDACAHADRGLFELQRALLKQAGPPSDDDHAGLHPYAAGAAGDVCPSSVSPMSRCSRATAAGSPMRPSG